MTRKPRLHIPGSIYHVMLRGNNGQKTFVSKKDYSKLCLLIQEGTERFDFEILGFCLMPNHFHFIIKIDETPLSTIVHNFAFRYTRYINGKYKRVGHLFQGRFKAILVEYHERRNTSYLTELIRYVHLNPVKANITQNPEDFFYNSHRSYIGKEDFTWVSKNQILQSFCFKGQKGKEAYLNFINDGIKKDPPFDFEKTNQKGIDVIGSNNYVESLILDYSIKKDTPPETTLETLLEATCKHFSTNVEALQAISKTGKSTKARRFLAYLTREYHECHLEDLAPLLNRKANTLSELACTLEKQIKRNPALKKEIESLKASLEK